MSNYHINQKTGNVNICRAKTDNCPLKNKDGEQVEHFEDKETAQKFLEQNLLNQYGSTQELNKKEEIKNLENKKQEKPQNIKAASYIPNFNNLSDISNYAEYDYDYTDYYSHEIDEENYAIHSINGEELAKSMVYRSAGTSIEEHEKIVNETEQMLQNIGALDTKNYNLRVRYGYYNDHETFIEPKRSFPLIERMKKEYYKKPDAKDAAGILEYVRSKGKETAGLSPFEAIKEQLNEENKGRKSSYVERSNKASKATLRVDNVYIGAKQHYENVEPRKKVSENDSVAFDGVLFFDNKSKTYHLIDGYHRMKDLKNNKRSTGTFIVLSE